MGYARPKRLEQDALRHLLVRIFDWEGALPKNALCDTNVLSSVVQHYATVIDGSLLGDERYRDDLQRLGKFLTEPSAKTLTAIVRATQSAGCTFKQSRTSASAPVAGPSIGPDGGSAFPAQIVDFMREHNDRCVVIMLSRGGGFTHSKIAKAFKISRSRCYRYEKWFERLPPMYRGGIIAVGTAAAKLHNGGPDAFAIASDFVSSPAALEIVEARCQPAEIIGTAKQSPPRPSNAAADNETPGFWKSVSQAILAPFTKSHPGSEIGPEAEYVSRSRS